MSGLPAALTIAGSDPSGGAGLQADLKVFHQFGLYGEAAVTLVTVQNTRGVFEVQCLPAELVRAQIAAVVDDIPPRAAKTGALGNRKIVEAVAEAARGFTFPLIVDPVAISKHGAALLDPGARDALRRSLIPQAFLITPNVPEAEMLSGLKIQDAESMRHAARAIANMGAQAVLVKGGHLAGETALDILYSRGVFHEFPGPRVDTPHTHGTGCSHSSAITALLARGFGLEDAVGRAKTWITEAIRTNPGLGGGLGPVNHFARTGE